MSSSSSITGLTDRKAAQDPRYNWGNVRIEGSPTLIFDLDQTLAVTKTLHIEIHKITAKALGIQSDEVVISAYEPLRGLSYTMIIAGMARSLQIDNATYERQLQYTMSNLDTLGTHINVKPILGAVTLLTNALDSGSDVLVCTGSPRSIAEYVLKRLGLLHRINPENLVCCGDAKLNGLNKSDPPYWELVLGSRNRGEITAFDDHHHGAEWLLDIVKVGRLIICPSTPIDAYDALRERHGDKLILVPNWKRTEIAPLNKTSPLSDLTLKSPYDNDTKGIGADHRSRQLLWFEHLGLVCPIVLVSGTPGDYSKLLDQLDRDSTDSVDVLTTFIQKGEISRDVIFACPSSNGHLVVKRSGLMGAITKHIGSPSFALSDLPRPQLIFIGDKCNTLPAYEAVASCVPMGSISVLHLGQRGQDFLAGFGISECSLPMNKHDLARADETIQFLGSQAITRSVELASKSLDSNQLDRKDAQLPAELYNFIANSLIPVAERHRCPILLRGGCAVAHYIPKMRPVSLDIDFTSLIRWTNFHSMTELISEISSSGVTITGEPGQPLSAESSHRRDRSTYVKGSILLPGGKSATVDGVAVVRRRNDNFTFEFKYDELLHSHHRVATYTDTNGRLRDIGLVAPELLLVEKLVAARGKPDKYDFFDAAGILAHQLISPNLISHMIERQRYDLSLDRVQIEAPKTQKELLEFVTGNDLITNPALREIIRERAANDYLGSDLNIARFLSPSTIKKYALVDQILRALSLVEREIYEPDSRLGGLTITPASMWSRDAIDRFHRNSFALKEHLYWLGRYQIGRHDILVGRSRRSYEGFC